MSEFFRRIKRSPFITKLLYWEHWPSYIVYLPISPYLLWLAIKSRSLFFFSASNPGIDTGGFYGESKISVLEKMPPAFIPITIVVKPGMTRFAIQDKLNEAQITFPLIVKPDIGERGFLVEKVNDLNELMQHLSRYPVDFLLQEYLDYDHEFNVLYYRIPGEDKGKITSITVKKYLSVTGDGKSTVEELIQQDVHAALQLERFRKEKAALLKQIPEKNVSIRVEPIGNHARGTGFFDGCHLINAQMLRTFDNIATQVPDMFIFRFDAKCKNPSGLETGESLKFVEVNGVGGEPTHIYQHNYPLMSALRALAQHWGIVYAISKVNNRNGIPSMSLNDGITKLKAYMAYKKKLSK